MAVNKRETVTNKERWSPEQVENALRAGMGIYSRAAQKLGCSPNTVRNYVERYPHLRHVCEEAIEQMLDFTESKLFKAIQRDNMTAIIFFLKTKGKGRGYSERHEVTAANGAALMPALDMSGLTDEQLERVARGLPAGVPASPMGGSADAASAGLSGSNSDDSSAGTGETTTS